MGGKSPKSHSSATSCVVILEHTANGGGGAHDPVCNALTIASQAVKPRCFCVATGHENVVSSIASRKVYCVCSTCKGAIEQLAQVASHLRTIDILVSVQADEPDLSGPAIDQLIELLETKPEVQMATLAAPIRSKQQLCDPACVKMILDRRGRLRYLSRSPIPHAPEWTHELLAVDPPFACRNVGLNAYRRDFLLRLAALPQTRIEALEGIESIRALESGCSVAVARLPPPARDSNAV